jgi:hypothetical protein
VHRDLKPGNVLLDDQDRVMLVDFGIAKEAIDSEQTRALGRAVTHGFSPPEQAMGSGTDARSDVYALGATVYYMLTAQRPPGARERIQGVEIPLPSALVPGMPPAIDRALLQALSLNPNERQQTVQEFGRAFDYDAPTIKTYDDFAGPDRTVMVGSAATSRSVPNTSPQKSLKLGPDGAAVVVEQPPAAPRGNQRAMLVMAGLALLAIAIGGTYLLTKPAPANVDATPPAVPAPQALVSNPPAAPAAVAPPAVAAVPESPVVPASPAVSSQTAALAPPAPVPTAPGTASNGPSAMEELMKRRQASLEPEAPVVPDVKPVATPKPKPKPVATPAKPAPPKPVLAAAPPAPVMAPPAPVAPASPEAAADAWRAANKNTQFQE